MIVKLKTIRSSFCFIGPISLVKGANPLAVDLTQVDDKDILCIVLSIVSGQIEADAEAIKIAEVIKDFDTKVVAYATCGQVLETGNIVDVIETEAEVVSEEPAISADESLGIDPEYIEYVDTLKELLSGTVKVVLENLANASVNDEDKIKLIELEEADKNRKAVINAINELE